MTPRHADVVLHRGVLLTQEARQPVAEAIAVAGGRILAVGRSDDLLPLAGPGTRLVDLAGRTLVPGFVDAHAHVWKIGHLLTSLLDVRTSAGMPDLQAQLRQADRRLPHGAWLLGRGFNEARLRERRMPVRADLDAAVPDRPVVLTRTCGHIVACNSAALRAAGLRRDTGAPAGGIVDRDEAGEPTGILRETAMGLVTRHVPTPTRSDYVAMIEAALDHQRTLGITSTTDAGVQPALADAYRSMDAQGRLGSRVNVMALRLVDGVGLVPLGDRRVSDHLRLDTVKFFADGGLSGATAALRTRYRHAETQGVMRLEEQELAALAREAHGAGWRIATHAIGDGAIEMVLRVYAELGGGTARPRIEHFGLPDASQLAQAAALGVIVVPQTVFVHALGRNFRAYLPDGLLARAYPVRAMLDAGLTVALSSDAPVVADDNPLLGMQAAILRRDDEGEAIAADQTISAAEALAAYTIGGAAASGDEGNRGSLSAGKWADFAVLSANPLAVAPEALTSIRVEQTWIGGQMVFETC